MAKFGDEVVYSRIAFLCDNTDLYSSLSSEKKESSHFSIGVDIPPPRFSFSLPLMKADQPPRFNATEHALNRGDDLDENSTAKYTLYGFGFALIFIVICFAVWHTARKRNMMHL